MRLGVENPWVVDTTTERANNSGLHNCRHICGMLQLDSVWASGRVCSCNCLIGNLSHLGFHNRVRPCLFFYAACVIWASTTGCVQDILGKFSYDYKVRYLG